MAVTFHTTDYEFSHGKKPRGSGSWAFQKCDYRGRVADGSDVFFCSFGTMTECKKQVRAARPDWENISWAP